MKRSEIRDRACLDRKFPDCASLHPGYDSFRIGIPQNRMVGYPRNVVPGGTFFFTVTLDDRRSSALVDRRSSALVDHVTLLRAAFRKTRGERPFVVDAIVVLPDHLHAIMTLPPGDLDFSGRWRRIKSVFTRGVVAAGSTISLIIAANIHFGKSVFGNTPFATIGISNAALTISISIRSSIAWSPRPPTGRSPRCPGTSAPGCWPRIGVAAVMRTTATSVNVETDPDCASLHPGYDCRYC